MGSNKPIVLYFHAKLTTFVKRDLDMLQEKYEVKGFEFFHQSKIHTPLLFFRQLVFIIRNLNGARISFCMFAGYHSFLPALFSKIFKKPFVIILGGTDSVLIPSLNYGILRKGLIGRFARWSYQMTDHFAPVHRSLISYENTYDESMPKYQGLKNLLPAIDAEFTVIHNGFDSKIFYNLHRKRISNSFLSVAFDLHKPNLFQLKGADLIIKIAPHFPDCTFTIVGLKEIKNCPKNVYPKPAVAHDELLELYNSHEFYFQLSITEGFPNALCEAMLCGCIPIVSNVSSMPEIIDDAGFILKKREEDKLCLLIKEKVLYCQKERLSLMASSRITSHYPLIKRRTAFDKLIENLSFQK